MRGQQLLGQRSFDDLGTPLFDVTFVVLDLETTGATAANCKITEIGAVKYRRGEKLGEFHTLVNPEADIPPTVTVLTGSPRQWSSTLPEWAKPWRRFSSSSAAL